MNNSKLTSKFQATIPSEIRKLLNLKAGDRLVFDVTENNAVVIRKATKKDVSYLKMVEKTLSEWESEHDEKAFRNL